MRARVRKQRSGAGPSRDFPGALAWPDTRLVGVGRPRNEGRVFQMQRYGERSGCHTLGRTTILGEPEERL